jgi:regulator of sirC expression with transglutaminase-like and TPR domain
MELARLFERPEESIDLGRAALVPARIEYPDLDLDAEIARLDALAAQARPAVASQQGPAARVFALCSFLGQTCGFCGNEDDYYDPRNSFLNQVLERRTGIPITLSVVYMEVGRRLGLPLEGVGLPGHFLVKYQGSSNAIFLDPFHGGRALSGSDCRQLIEQLSGGQIEFREEFLAAVDKRYILLRILNNLRSIYMERRQMAKALEAVDMALALAPDSPDDVKLHGALSYQLRRYGQARQDLERYLALSPEASDAEEVRRSLDELRRLSAMLN